MKLRDYLDKRGISPSDLAQRLGIDRRTVLKIMDNPCDVRGKYLAAIVEYTGHIVSANDILQIDKKSPSYKSVFYK